MSWNLLNTIRKPGIMFVLGVLSVLIVALILPENIPAISVDIPLQTQTTREKPSPNNYLEESQIHVYKDRIVIDVSDVLWAGFEDTKSMLPVIDDKSNALQIKPDCPSDVNVGDIISYKSKFADGIIIHRVVYEGQDNEGPYFILKGDNNPSNDPGKIRCEQIERRVIGILY